MDTGLFRHLWERDGGFVLFGVDEPNAQRAIGPGLCLDNLHVVVLLEAALHVRQHDLLERLVWIREAHAMLVEARPAQICARNVLLIDVAVVNDAIAHARAAAHDAYASQEVAVVASPLSLSLGHRGPVGVGCLIAVLP